MKFPDKFYVGFQKGRYENEENIRMLGFAIPHDNTSAFTKRKNSVDRWREEEIPPIIIDNVPMNGFKIVDTVSRYSTSNKLFRVLDPRGFELEISAENLFDIITNHTLVKGLITEPMIWGRDSGNYLIAENSKIYQDSKVADVPTKHTKGDYFKNQVGNIIYRYEGVYYMNAIKRSVYRNSPRYPGRWWPMETERTYEGVTTNVVWYINGKKNDKVHVYTEWYVNAMGGLERSAPVLNVRKSLIRNLSLIASQEVKQTIQDFKVPLNEFLPVAYMKDGLYIRTYNYMDGCILFETNAEAMNKEYTNEILSGFYNVLDSCKPYGYYGTITYTINDDRIR